MLDLTSSKNHSLDRRVGAVYSKVQMCVQQADSLRANVKSSMTHHSREQYVGPATTSSFWQPARKTGKQASDCWMLLWSMHALSCAVRRVWFHRVRARIRW